MDDRQKAFQLMLDFLEMNSIDVATSMDVMQHFIALVHVKSGEAYEDYYYNMKEASIKMAYHWEKNDG